LTFDLNVRLVGSNTFKIKDIKLNLLGNHNVLNATAAIAIALNIGIKVGAIKKSLKIFSGIQRRFTKIFSINKVDFYDDYAHHPTEIKALLEGARDVYKNRKLVSVFQPHRYSRAKLLEKEFAESFKLSNTVILCPVYAAGEKVNRNFNQEDFSKLITKKSNTQVINIKNKSELSKYIKKNLFTDELVICMGAGSISNWIREISKEI
jgi:UDP-N-acetylmuramate--alanine ligase